MQIRHGIVEIPGWVHELKQNTYLEEWYMKGGRVHTLLGSTVLQGEYSIEGGYIHMLEYTQVMVIHVGTYHA